VGTTPIRWTRAAISSAPVWLALFIGAFGFAGLFCVFNYMATTMLQLTRVSERGMPFAIGAFGVGSLIGAQLKAHPADA
jgi:DHA1 family inner membrane transport protein